MSLQATSKALPKTIIYKTKENYINLIPVTLDNTKSQLISYPDPSDVMIENSFATPLLLTKGYLLDRRGITLNSVFTNYTYEEYSKLLAAPSPEEFLKNLKEKDPLIEIYQCPLTSDTSIINQWINEGIEKYCKKLK